MGKRILMLVGDYVEDYEAMAPLQMLLMVGHQVDTVCPGQEGGRPGGAPPSTTSKETRPTARSGDTTSGSMPDFAEVKAERNMMRW